MEGHGGIKRHSYYLGDSIFSKLPLPKAFRRNRLTERFFDPVFCSVAGYWLLKDPDIAVDGLGVWLLIAGIFLIVVELRSYRTLFVTNLNVVDGLVFSEYQGGKVETFDDQSKEAANCHKSSEGISTGLDPYLQQKIRERQ